MVANGFVCGQGGNALPILGRPDTYKECPHTGRINSLAKHSTVGESSAVCICSFY